MLMLFLYHCHMVSEAGDPQSTVPSLTRHSSDFLYITLRYSKLRETETGVPPTPTPCTEEQYFFSNSTKKSHKLIIFKTNITK